MFTEVGTLLFYIAILVICMAFLRQYERNKKHRFWLWLSYFVILLISIIRYDIGNDYDGYVDLIDDVSKSSRSGNGLFELIIDYLWADVAIVVLSWVCAWLRHPFLGVYFLFSIINTLLLYKVCERYDIHKLGVFFFFISGYLFITWDGARQGCAIMVFLYSLRFIENQSVFKYLICVIIAALFHKSSLFLLPCYYLQFFRLYNWIYLLLASLFLLIYWSGMMDSIQTQSLDLLSYTGEYYSKYSNPDISSSEGIASTTYKLRITIKTVFWTIWLVLLPEKNTYLKNMIIIGVLFTILSNGSLTLLRVGWYFLAVCIIAMPLALRLSNRYVKIIIMTSLFMLLFLFCWDTYNKHNNGCTPYETIFSSNFEKGRFRADNW